MTEHLRLPEALKKRIEQAAHARGKTAEQAVLDALQESFPEVATDPHHDLRAMLAVWRKEDLAMPKEESDLNSEVLRSIDEHRPHRKLFQNVLQEPTVP